MLLLQYPDLAYLLSCKALPGQNLPGQESQKSPCWHFSHIPAFPGEISHSIPSVFSHVHNDYVFLPAVL